MTKSSENQGLVIVTGASTGMGAATALELARRRFHVLAGVRRDSDGEALRAAGVEPVILDITNPDHVAALAARVDRDPQKRPLLALVNNAGIPGAGPIEVMPLDQWRRIFEVNLFGHIAITQALLPALVRSKGRIVNISSVNGKLSMAGYGPYASSKHAMEAMSDALRNELAPHGVEVVVVEPGGVKTEMAGHGLASLSDLGASMTAEQNVRYGALVQALPSHVAAFTKAGVTSEVAAKTIAKAVTDRKPRTRYIIGRMATFLIRASSLLPDRALDRMTTSDLRKHYPAESRERTTASRPT
jgi:NAD(P)-dependent dehydrogenase (short-subunit alcohol dehydrogenase family)